MKILVVEDDSTTRRMVSSCVERAGHAAVCCSGGNLAWSILQDNPDTGLIITDILMPDLDGRELVQKVRADPKLATIPVVMISGTVRLSEIHQMLELGALRFLPKPVRLDELKKYVTSLIEERKATRSAQDASQQIR